ncbi:hypothetical protein [Spirosoma horti]
MVLMDNEYPGIDQPLPGMLVGRLAIDIRNQKVRERMASLVDRGDRYFA